MKRITLIAPVVAIAAALALAGCGGDSNDSSGGGGAYGGSPAPATTTASAKAPASSGGAAEVATASGAVGPMLVDGQGRTLYLWEADTSDKSTCADACAEAWPPATTKAAVTAGGSVDAKLLGTSERADGTTQVTYAGHPLYTFAGDTAAGQLNGQGSDGFGAEWWAVSPGGAAITKGAS
jgi:predicted lipoprotein with Yx(FWY)xxD motif